MEQSMLGMQIFSHHRIADPADRRHRRRQHHVRSRQEKTREIGVQMALGAHRSWITWPFVLQGVAYTLLGGRFSAWSSLSFWFLDCPGTGRRQPGARIPRQTDTVVAHRGGNRSDSGNRWCRGRIFPARRASGIDPRRNLEVRMRRRTRLSVGWTLAHHRGNLEG